ncbi:unnamed protein product, partial [marine sediment metagenome]
QIYPEETLQEFFNWQLCLERGQTEDVLRAKGVPTPQSHPDTHRHSNTDSPAGSQHYSHLRTSSVVATGL